MHPEEENGDDEKEMATTEELARLLDDQFNKDSDSGNDEDGEDNR